MGDHPTIAAWRAAGESPGDHLLRPAAARADQVMAGTGPRLLRRQGRPGLARLVGLATGPLNAMTHTGEQRIMPKAAPPD